MKYALILTYSRAYLPAMNALLNSLEQFEHDGIEVHVLYHTDLNSIVETVLKARFPFTIKFVPVVPYFNPAHGCYINFMFAKYNYAQTLAGYDALCHLDGDVLLMSSLMPYFEIAAKTNLIPCATFPHSSGVKLHHYKTRDADWAAQMGPLANFPVFYSPKLHMDLVKYCWSHMPLPTDGDRARNNEMYVFNKAVHTCGRVPYILQMPGNYWVSDAFLHQEALAQTWEGGIPRMHDFLCEQIHLIHNKFWKEGVANGELSRTKANPHIPYDLVKAHIDMMNAATDFFNTKCRLKLADLPAYGG